MRSSSKRRIKTKVLYVIPQEALGGPQWRVLQVAKRLKEEGFTSIVAMPEGDKTFANLLNESGISYYQVKNFKKLQRPSLNPFMHLRWFAFFIPGILSLMRLIKVNKVDIVLTSGFPGYLQGPLAARLSGVKLVWHLDGFTTPKLLKWLLFPLFHLLPNRVAVSSKAIEEYYFGNNIPSRGVSLLYPPIDTNKFHPDFYFEEYRKYFGLKESERVVGIVGNINPDKGYEYFFSAVKLIKDSFPNVKFIAVGLTPKTQKRYWERLQALIVDLTIEEDLILTGARTDIAEIVNTMDIFVLSSVTEGAGTVLLEAMACGKPVVATNVGGVPEIIIDGETGILVPPKDSKAIAGAVLYLLNHPEEAKEMGLKGRKRVIEHFEVEKCVERYREMFQSI